MCSSDLPAGIAYVSYNTYPGAHLREISREMMLYHTRNIPDVRERAREATRFFERARAAVHADPHYAAVMAARAVALAFAREGGHGLAGGGQAFVIRGEERDVEGDFGEVCAIEY